MASGKITSFFAKKREATDDDDTITDDDESLLINDLQKKGESDEAVDSSDFETDQPSCPVDTAESPDGRQGNLPVSRGIPKKKRRKEVKKFPKQWLITYNWLKYDQVENHMYCELCRKQNKQGPWTTGTSNYRLKMVQTHLKSEDHLTSVAAVDPLQRSIRKGAKDADLAKRRSVIVALKTAYWVITEEVANKKYKSLLQYIRHIGNKDALALRKGANATYESPDIFNQLLTSLDTIIVDRLILELRQSPYVAIGLDESTDRSQEKHLVAVVRYITRNKSLQTTFLRCKTIRDGTAPSLFETTLTILQEFAVRPEKVLGLGTDGASVMASDRNGVNGLMKNANPHCIFVHCVCHRLALAVSQACKKNHDMNTVSTILSAVYTFVQSSPNHLQSLKSIADVLDQATVKFVVLYDIRWLSMGNAVQAVLRNYEPLMVLISQEAAKGEPIAIGLHQQLSSYKYLALLHLAADVLNTTNHLSRLLQFRDVSFASLRTKVQDTLETLSDMRHQDGIFLAQFEEMITRDPEEPKYKNVVVRFHGQRREGDLRDSFRDVRAAFLGRLLDNIRSRFPHVDILHAMQIFEPAAYPANRNQLLGWGNDHLQTLLAHYGEPLTNEDGQHFPAVVDPEHCREEFMGFKRLVHHNLGEDIVEDGIQRYHYYRPTELLTKLFGPPMGDTNLITCASMYQLMCCSLCVLVGNAEAERVFSCQNRLKTRLRTRLSVANLDRLIRLSYAHIEFDDFPFEQAADNFLNAGNRRI